MEDLINDFKQLKLNNIVNDLVNEIINNLIDKLEIIEIFRKKIKGNTPDLKKYNNKHSGKLGHWLETQMNIKHNSKNEPDINGYEMKKKSNKITLGDFSASEYLFSKDKKFINEKNNWSVDYVKITRDEFIKIFGTQKETKNNRYSWSGSCVHKYNIWNECGQKLIITKTNDICIYYSYSKDKRKINIPDYLKKDDILIVFWKNEKMEKHINNKFNNKGFFIIKDNKKICFGKPFNFEHFIESMKKKYNIF
jgi:hypothetical protein